MDCNLKGTHIEIRGVRVGIVQGKTAFLFKDLSGRDKRYISDAWKEIHGHGLSFAQLGTIQIRERD